MASKNVRLGKFYFTWNLPQPQGWGWGACDQVPLLAPSLHPLSLWRVRHRLPRHLVWVPGIANFP